MSMPEILAPAGSFDALTAALRCGADAVYIGGKNFSARQSAANFDINEMKQAAALCHLYGAKLYLTVNTILLDEEVSDFAGFIRDAANAGIDACIVQDIGAAEIIRRTVPDMPLHGSTQMTIHTKEGVLWAKEHGFCRVVAARELSREEILPLTECGIEIEQFVHGALCMSISGQCYLSALIGSRSANRGRCAQACRLPFSSCGNKNASCLSLIDLSLVQHMDSLIADGIASLKIEGRMKRPEYVAAAVSALKDARDGRTPDMDALKAVFSRSGFTDGYYTGKRNDMFGVRAKDDVTAANDVLPKLRNLYQKPPHPVAVDIYVKIKAGEPAEVTGRDSDGNSVTVYGDIPQPAMKKATDKEQLERQLSKLGDTIYKLENLHCQCDGVSMLPASSLNALRRDLTEKLDSTRIKNNTPLYRINAYSHKTEEAASEHKGTPLLRFRVINEHQLSALSLSENESCIIPMELAEKTDPDGRYILQPPRFVPDEEKLKAKLELLCKKGFNKLLCENPAHIRTGKALGFELYGGMDLHTSNSVSAEFFRNEGIHDIILSPELTLKQISALNTGIHTGVYAYGKLSAMLMRQCPIKNEIGCKKCTGSLTDRTKRKFPVICSGNYTELLNSVPIWMADKLPEFSGCSFILIDFTDESPDLVKHVSDAYRNGADHKPDDFTRGLLYRGIESRRK